jgi:hypothetical protein
MPSVLSFRAKRGQKTNSASCPREAARCRPVSHAARIATPFGCCKPAVLSVVSACRRFQDQGARPPPLPRPRAPFNWLAVHGKPLQRRSPEIGRAVASVPVRESASPDTRTITAVNTPPKRPEATPAVPAVDFCHNPGDGICRQKTPVPNEQSLFLSNEEPQTECSRISPQTFQMQRRRLHRRRST